MIMPRTRVAWRWFLAAPAAPSTSPHITSYIGERETPFPRIMIEEFFA
jgi:hypothetical protein